MQVVLNLNTEFTVEIHFLFSDKDDVRKMLDDNKWKYDCVTSVHMKRTTFLIFDMTIKKVVALKKLLKDKGINNYH